MRSGASDDDLRRTVIDGWQRRQAQGAVDRQQLVQRASAVEVSLLKRDPHLEMHTRGG